MSIHLAIILSSISILTALSMLIINRKILTRIGISTLALFVLILTGCSYHNENEPKAKKADDEKQVIVIHENKEENVKQPFLKEIDPYVIRDDFKGNISKEEIESYKQIIDAILNYQASITLNTDMYSNILLDYLIDASPYANLVKNTHFDDTYQTMYIDYNYSKDKHAHAINVIHDFYYDLINNHIEKDMNDVDKTLMIYQCIGNYMSYDYDWYERFINSEDPYHFPEIKVVEGIKRKKGVCHTYCYMMQFALQQLGIENILVQGLYNDNYDDQHMWMMVKLNQHYYHIDPTWDDQNEDGNVSLQYFGLSDQQREAQGFTMRSGYYNVEYGEILCENTDFDNLHNVKSYTYKGNHKWLMKADEGSFDYET